MDNELMNDAAFREALGRESAAICLVMLLVEEGLSSQQTPRKKTLPYSSSVEGRLRREVRRGVPDHHRAAPGQARSGGGGGGGGGAATAAAGPATAAEVEVVQEAFAAADGVRPLLRWWREREEKGRKGDGARAKIISPKS